MMDKTSQPRDAIPATASGFETMSPQTATITRYYRWLYETIRPRLGRHVLEVGPGYGNLAALITADGARYTGVDLDAGVVDWLRRRFTDDPRAEFLQGDVCDPALIRELASREFDTVLSVNVIEHVASPEPMMSALAAAAPRAALTLFVPAHPFLYGTLDRQGGHYRRYRPEDVRRLLDGLADIDALRYFNSLGVVSWFVAGRVLRLPLDGEATGGLVSIYDRFVVPVARRLDALTGQRFGLSLLCQARFR